MNRILAAILLMSAVIGKAHAQGPTPGVLLHAAQCLAAKHFFATSKEAVLSFGYVLDEKSYPGENVAYVVLYSGSDRSHGMAFTVFVAEQQGRHIFNIQNNATFVRTKSGVDFTGEPLGGIWTQQRLVSAIEQVQRQRRFDIPATKLRPSPLVRCKAYTDK